MWTNQHRVFYWFSSVWANQLGHVLSIFICLRFYWYTQTSNIFIMLIPILIVVQWLQMNYSQLERFSRAVLRHERNFEIEGEGEGWTALCIMQNDSPDSHNWYGTSLTIIFCLQWHSIIGIWCWLAIILHAKINSHLRIITIKISKIPYMKNSYCFLRISYSKHSRVFFVLFHTCVQKPPEI